jgi:hypothetical protein
VPVLVHLREKNILRDFARAAGFAIFIAKQTNTHS